MPHVGCSHTHCWQDIASPESSPLSRCLLSPNALSWQDLARQTRVHGLQVITIPFSHPAHNLGSKPQVRCARICQRRDGPCWGLCACHRAGFRCAAAWTHFCHVDVLGGRPQITQHFPCDLGSYLNTGDMHTMLV